MENRNMNNKQVINNQSDSKTKKAVVGQIVNMLNNNILENAGPEPFMGWVEDGDVFVDTLSESEVNQAIELSMEVAPYIDKISQILA